jgi:hypothetical protein
MGDHRSKEMMGASAATPHSWRHREPAILPNVGVDASEDEPRRLSNEVAPRVQIVDDRGAAIRGSRTARYPPCCHFDSGAERSTAFARLPTRRSPRDRSAPLIAA